MPMWAAVAVVAAAYVVRSLIRGGDFRPDLPMDAILAAVLVCLVIVRVALARSAESDDAATSDYRAADERRD
jgi:hypothetical protein